MIFYKGGGGGGSRISDFFLQRIQIYNCFFFFFGGGGIDGRTDPNQFANSPPQEQLCKIILKSMH